MSPCAQDSHAGPADASVLDILIVEDEPAFRALLADFLQRAGYTVRAVPNGRVALTLLAKQCPRLLITDIFMPGADGIELLTSVRRTHPELSIVAMSGSAGQDLELFLKIARHLGAQHTLTKPFALKEFLAVVQAEIGDPCQQ